MANYEREDKYDLEKIEQLKYHYHEVLRLLGEDPEREGLIKTPERVAKAWSYLTKGYEQDPIAILQSAMFKAPAAFSGCSTRVILPASTPAIFARSSWS